MAGGNTYEHNCSSCGKWSNSFKDYYGCLNYSLDEYDKLTDEDVVASKDTLVNKFIYDVKNPPVEVEPTKEELESMKVEFEKRVSEINSKISIIEAEAMAEAN